MQILRINLKWSIYFDTWGLENQTTTYEFAFGYPQPLNPTQLYRVYNSTLREPENFQPAIRTTKEKRPSTTNDGPVFMQGRQLIIHETKHL